MSDQSELPVQVWCVAACLLALSAGASASSSGRYPLVQTLSPDSTQGEAFGSALAIEGRTLVVGAPSSDDFGANSGAVYVYELGPDGWLLSDRLTASDGSNSHRFGSSVAISGDTLVIAARRQRVDRRRRGAVYVFEKLGGEWVETRKLISVEPARRERPYGQGVLVSGSRLAVQSTEGVDVNRRGGGDWPRDEMFAQSGAIDLRRKNLMLRRDLPDFRGVITTFHRRGSGWVERDSLLEPVDKCAWSDASSRWGKRLAVSDPTDSRCPQRQPGQVHLYRRSGGRWLDEQVVQPVTLSSLGAEIGFFGRAVALGDRVLIVRAFERTFPFWIGTVYVFERRGGNWSEVDKLGPENPDPEDQVQEYGRDLLVGDDHFFVSIPQPQPGRLQVYRID